MDPQSGGSIEICLSSVMKPDNFSVEINSTELEAVVKVDQTVVKTDSPPIGVSIDGGGEGLKSSEDTNCVAEPKGEDGLVESSDSSGIKSVDVGEENSDFNGKLSNSSDMKSDDVDGDNSDDSELNGYGSAEPEPEPELESVPVQAGDIDMDDPLEIARKVAIEIKEEAEGQEEEKSSGSSDGAPENEVRIQEDLSKEKESEDMIMEKASEPVIEAENLVIEPVNAANQEIEQSQVMNLLINREPLSTNVEKSVCDFDLNEEVQVEMNDELDNQSLPTLPPPPVRAAVVPFQFGGRSLLSRNIDFDLNNCNPVIESPKLDLNFATDDGERQSNHVINNGYHNFRSAERSLFDLNEHYGDNSNNKSVVSLMGVKLEVNRRERVLNSGYFFNRLNPYADAELTRTGGLYATANDTSIYTAGLSPPAVSTEMYGQYNRFPYIFNSVGPAVVPGFPNQHPMIGMTSLSGSNGVRPVRFNLLDSVGASPDIPQFQHGLLNPPMFGGMSSMSGSNAVGPSSGFVFYDSIDAQIRSGLLNPHPMMGISNMPGSNGVGPSRFHLGSNSVGPSGGFNVGPNGSGPSGFNLGSNGSGPSGFSLGSNGSGPSGFSLGSSGVGPTGFNLGGSNGAGSSGFNLDLNAGSFLDGNRDNNGGIREYYQQPTANLIGGMKRGEPDSEWEPEGYPFKHHRPNRE